MNHERGFGSDNNAGVHRNIWKAMRAANTGHVKAYGDDPYTAEARRKFQEHLGDVEVFLVFSGTPANVLGLQAMTSPFNGIICSAMAHINVDECGAPEKHTGCKLLPIVSADGKITVEQIKRCMHGVGDEHHVQPRVVSLTQATEYGTVYTLGEIKAIADYAHAHKCLVHMDGARIANAAVSLGLSLREITGDAGVDVLSFGGTKNGMMYGEAVIFFNTGLCENFKYIRKQGTQLASKMRFIAAQFTALLSDDLWWKNARHANEMAKFLADELNTIPQVHITQKVQANAVFVTIPKKIIPLLQEEYFFYVWDEETGEVRLMTSFDTAKEDIENLVTLLRRLVK